MLHERGDLPDVGGVLCNTIGSPDQAKCQRTTPDKQLPDFRGRFTSSISIPNNAMHSEEKPCTQPRADDEGHKALEATFSAKKLLVTGRDYSSAFFPQPLRPPDRVCCRKTGSVSGVIRINTIRSLRLRITSKWICLACAAIGCLRADL